MSATATKPTQKKSKGQLKGDAMNSGQDRESEPRRRQQRKEPIDYRKVLDVVKEAGFKETLTDVIDVYMENDDEKAAFQAVKAHATFQSFPHWLRQGIKDNGENALKLVIMTLFNVMAEEIRADVWRLTTGSSNRAWTRSIDELREHLDANS
jgi:hypothetical protein